MMSLVRKQTICLGRSERLVLHNGHQTNTIWDNTLGHYPEHRGLITINWLFNWDFHFFFKFSFLLILGIDFFVSGIDPAIDSLIDFLVLIF